MTIYDRIKQLREEQGLSQQALAEKVGFKTASAVNKIELGLRDINQSKVIEFAKALNTTPAYLMGWEDQEEKTIETDSLSLIKQRILNNCSNLSEKELNHFLKLVEHLSDKNIEKLFEYGNLLLTSQKTDEHSDQ